MYANFIISAYVWLLLSLLKYSVYAIHWITYYFFFSEFFSIDL